MASILGSLPLTHQPPPCRATATTELPNRCLLRFTLKQRPTTVVPFSYLKLPITSINQSVHRRFLPFSAAAYGETTETEEVEEVSKAKQEDSEDEAVVKGGTDDGGVVDSEERTTSILLATLQSYKDALANDDQSIVAEMESFLLSIEEEKDSLAKKIASFTEELSIEKDRVLRISADFDNFRKRTEKERLSLMTNVQGEVLERLLPVLDNFERAKSQIKVETEGEEKINDSYQSIYKQFVEILDSIGVQAVETVGSAFDPMLHEAIMREDSEEFEEGIILQEFRKGVKLGDRLLRPAMVKVSAGPGPAKSEVLPVEVGENNDETSTESTEEGYDGSVRTDFCDQLRY